MKSRKLPMEPTTNAGRLADSLDNHTASIERLANNAAALVTAIESLNGNLDWFTRNLAELAGQWHQTHAAGDPDSI